MDTITVINPVHQYRLESFMRATQKAIVYNLTGITWAKGEIAWTEEQRGTALEEWAMDYQNFAKGELAAYREELKKSIAHYRDLQKRLDEIETPL
jgi:hypothetical protein